MATTASEIACWQGRFRAASERIQQLENLAATLAAEVDRQRAWKESAMTLLTRYDNLAETFGGKPGSSKVTNLENGVAALRVVVKTAQRAVLSEGAPARLVELSEAVHAYEAAHKDATHA